MKNNKLITIITNNEIYKFEETIDKFALDIYKVIKKYYSEDYVIYNFFYSILSSIWYENISLQFNNTTLLEYIDFMIKSNKSIKDFKLFERKKSFITLSNKNLSDKAVIQRHLLYIRECLIEDILLKDFKKEVKANNIHFEKALNLIKRIITSNGYVYNRVLTWSPRIYLYLIDNEYIYIKSLNMVYESMLEGSEYIKIKISDIKEFMCLNEETLQDKFILEYNKKERLVISDSKKIEFIELKKYLLKILKENK